MNKEKIILKEDEDEIDDDFRCTKYFVVSTGKANISSLQSQFYWGYNRAAFAMRELEEKGIVGPITKGEPYREVLVTIENEAYQS